MDECKFIKVIDTYKPYDSLFFPDYLTLSDFSNFNIYGLKEFEVLGEYNYIDGFKRILLHKKINQIFHIEYKKMY